MPNGRLTHSPVANFDKYTELCINKLAEGVRVECADWEMSETVQVRRDGVRGENKQYVKWKKKKSIIDKLQAWSFSSTHFTD